MFHQLLGYGTVIAVERIGAEYVTDVNLHTFSCCTSGPVVNPIVFTATLLAFPSHPEITIARMGLAFAVAASIGMLVYVFVRRNPLRMPKVAATEVKTHPGFKMAQPHVHANAHDQQ